MLSTFKTRLLTGFAITAILFGAAGAQDKPNKLETQPKPEIVERDPFVNQLSDSFVPPRHIHRPDSLNPHYHNEQPDIEPDAMPEKSVAVAPDVSVTGIVGNNGTRQAILRSGSDTRIVQVGQKLSDYRVSKISSDAVTLSFGSQNFEIELDSEF